MDKSLKPRIYTPTEKDFSHNGLGILIETTRADVKEQANGAYELELEYPLKSRFKQYFENGYQIKVKPNDLEEYHIFEIKRTYEDTFGNNILVYAQSRTYKLGNRQVQHVEIESATGAEAMREITASMDLPSDIILYSDIQTVSSTLFEARNVLNCIAGEQGSLLQYWGGEIKREPFKLSLLRRRGRDNVGTVRYGKDLQGLKITLDWSAIVTRCLPYADLQNGDDGQTKRIYGEPVNSYLVGNYPDVYARYVQFTEEQGVKDEASLNQVAKNYFKSANKGVDKPKISVELEIEKLTDTEEAKEFANLRNYGLFDTFAVYHKLYDVYLESKITEVTYDSLNEKMKKIYAGDAQVTFYQQQNSDFQETIKTLTKKGYMSEFVDYVTNLINGVEGGSILQYPKNKPHTTYYLDTDSRETAKNVIAINNQGIGFSQTGWRGPFTNAWSIDGTLIADFITAGVLRAIRIEGVEIFGSKFETTTDDTDATMRIENGLMQFFDQDNKFIALIGASTLSGEKSISIQVSSDDGQMNNIVINETNTLINHSKKVSVRAPEVVLSGDVKVNGSLSLNGVDINTSHGGSGGGEWGGDYPSIVTTQAQKFAWEAWATLRLLGYSESAAAGILGNINGEAGPSMNPDTEQVGGPAYGAVQFDGSAYPLIGAPTNDGREYFQRLHSASGVGGDYREMSTQMKVVNWATTNGQWIGKVSPQTLAGYKAETNPENAAYAFEENFERPANAHPERQGYARNWYDLFKGVAITTSDKWTNPLHDVSYTVTQEWDQIGYGTGTIHGGIDLAPNSGATPPIYAARNGVVEQIVLNDPTGGNYVIVKHSDNYWTYYGHLNSVSVSQGDSVSTNTKLGICGATGLATGVHLHFEVWHGGQWQRINPRNVINF